MKTLFRTLPKPKALLASLIVLATAALVLQTNFVRGNAAIRPALRPAMKPTANNNPVVGAKVVLSNMAQGPGYKVIATATTDANGNFKLTSSNAYIYVGGYNLSFTPAGGAPATPLQVWATFGLQNGYTVNNTIGNRGAISGTGSVIFNGSTGSGNPVAFSSNKLLRVVLSINLQSISGTLKD